MLKFHLRKLLRQKELTQAELARRTGVRRATIFNLVNGYTKEIRLKDLHAICREFDCQISDIIEYIPDKK